MDETTGKISSLQIKYTGDTGSVGYADDTLSALDTASNVYNAEGWQMDNAVVQTNTASNTWTRAPGECHQLLVSHCPSICSCLSVRP